MNVIKVTAFGEADQLVLASVPTPSPGPGHVLVGVEASGVGLFDTLIRRGLYPGLTQPGLVLGGEVAGTVLAVGEGVEATWLGQRVYALLRTGGYAEQVVIAAAALVPLPDALSAVDAVGLGINALVAYFALEQARVQAGEHVLVRGAGGGIGVMATQLSLVREAQVTAVTSSVQRQQQLRTLGATWVLDRAAATTTEAVDSIIDAVAGLEMPAYFARLAPNGRYMLVGVAGGLPPADFGMGLLHQLAKSPSLSFLSLDSIPPHRLLAATIEIFTLATHGRLKAIIDRTYPLVQAAEAHRRLESGAVFGKLVLVP